MEQIEEIKKKGRDLLAISFAIILFILGDGNIKETALLGGSLSFDGDFILKIAGFAIYIYLFIRFHIINEKPIIHFQKVYTKK